MFVYLLCDDNLIIEEKYLPGTWVEQLDPSTNMLLAGTVMDIPFPLDISASDGIESNQPYTILFDNDTTDSVPLSKMAGLIPPLPVQPPSTNDHDSLLPPFLRLNSCITHEHDGQYHKGYLTQCNGVFWFSYKSHIN